MFKQFSYVFFLLAAATSASAAIIHADSYVVLVQTPDNPLLCGGVLLNKDTDLTSAQCLAFYDADQLVVAINNGTQIIKTKAHTFKTDFDFVTMENDLALLKLAQSVKAPYVKLASTQPKTGASGVVFNSGEVPVNIVNYKECASEKYVYSEEEIFSTMICGLVKDNKTCVGRAGSPLVSDNKLVGLVSWGGCGLNDRPAVFTDIPSFKSRITQTAKKL
ncbi:trypsin-like [Zeugodacus cucurbitae]|uniref:trypsin-like n=1 Tax=Zeugodacus cucurbitae TaxID=28588 RepID=UPI0023D96231|nr:trypsin-like [Zeugodacus cucurbitae]